YHSKEPAWYFVCFADHCLFFRDGARKKACLQGLRRRCGVLPRGRERGCTMALRANWDGFLRLNLVSIPVRAYTAAAPGHGKIAFHLIHKKCHSRIRYQKVCPIHGEVPKDEIVSGYEYAKGEYILLEGKDLSKLKTESDKTINIDTFIRSGDIDPLYFTERSYYLLPSGKVGEKPFAVFQKVMAQKERYAIAQMVFAGKQELVLIRPVDNLLVMT